tara:strand:- start:58363 stop:59220 length:858 start_codon:yes stop_codon:yes gene_type:complete
MVGSVGTIAMSAMSRISMGVEEHSSDFGIASLNVANGFANQDNPFGFSRLSPNNENGPAFTDMSSMGGLSGTAAISSGMVNAIQDVNFDTAHTDASFTDAIKDQTLSEGIYDLATSGEGDADGDVSTTALVSALVALAGTGGAVGSPTAVAAISNIGDTSTIGETGTESTQGTGSTEGDASVSEVSAPPTYTQPALTTSGGSGSSEALAGLGGSSELSGDAQQMQMSEKIASAAEFVSNDETRAQSGVGLAQTTKIFREMEAQTKLQDDMEILHAKILSQILMGV